MSWLSPRLPDGGAVSPWVQLIPFALVLGIFYFIILLPMRRKQKKVDEFIGSLKVGDKVVTTGGLYGSITRVGEASVQLQIADKVRVEISRSAIAGCTRARRRLPRPRARPR